MSRPAALDQREVERAAAEVEHQTEAAGDIGGVRGADRLVDEANVAKAREVSRDAHPRHRAPLGRGAADVLDRPADGDLVGCDAGELVRAVADVREHHGDELLEALRLAKHIGAHVELVPEERLQRLKQSARRRDVREDDRVDRLLVRV